MIVFIKENSRLAKYAAKRLKAQQVAMVIGNTIYLWGASGEEFLQNQCWVRHEVAHVHQYKRHGVLLFLYWYLVQSALHGYYNNRFEREARQFENDRTLLTDIIFYPLGKEDKK